MFSVGNKVEVSFDREDRRDTWFPATILEVIGCGSFLVEYHSSNPSDDAALLKATVDYLHIRPRPPHLRDKVYSLLEKVDAFCKFCWPSGVITKELAHCRYLVYFKHTNREGEFDYLELRPHMDWRDGKWFTSSQVILNPSDYQKHEGHLCNNVHSTEIKDLPANSGFTESNSEEKTPFSLNSGENQVELSAPCNEEPPRISSSPKERTQELPSLCSGQEMLKEEIPALPLKPTSKSSIDTSGTAGKTKFYNFGNPSSETMGNSFSKQPLGGSGSSDNHSWGKRVKRKRTKICEEDDNPTSGSGKTSGSSRKLQVESPPNSVGGLECDKASSSRPKKAYESSGEELLKHNGNRAGLNDNDLPSTKDVNQLDSHEKIQKRGRGRPRKVTIKASIASASGEPSRDVITDHLLGKEVITGEYDSLKDVEVVSEILDFSVSSQVRVNDGSGKEIINNQEKQKNKAGSTAIISPLRKPSEEAVEASVKQQERHTSKRARRRTINVNIVSQIQDSAHATVGKTAEPNCIAKELETVVDGLPNNKFEDQPLSKWFQEMHSPTTTDASRVSPASTIEHCAQTSLQVRQKWLKRRDKWLVVLGVVLHAVYMLSIFDIYFKTPIVHGMEPVTPRFRGTARRLVLLVADGLRADKFFEPDSDGNYRAPFLRRVIKERGRWGVSHARPPTESRPGHVAIIAGFYEDPSAVTKGWKANPVEFDSVFNRSRHTISYGSPDIVPIFCGAVQHSTWNTYPHEYEDFATDASFLDEWSFDQFESLLNRSNEDPKLKQLLLQDKLAIFLHLLGCDSNGHAHRPYSSIYLNNVKVVDRIAERVYNLVQSYFKDDSTAYIFTADHGMSDKGSHGDGHPSNTDTPLVAWGAGVRSPTHNLTSEHLDNTVRFVDEHMHDMPTPSEWGLEGIERLDVNQADIAPLMSTLLGLPCPVNSVGSLPLGYINFEKAQKVEAVLANTKQILNQFLRKSQLKRSNSIHFESFKPLTTYSLALERIEHLIAIKDYEAAMRLSEHLRSLALEGLHYFQTYDWFMLMTVITLGYIGWMIYILLHVLQSYTSLPETFVRKKQMVHMRKNSGKVYFIGCLLLCLVCTLLLLEHSPPLYHAYAAMTIFLWTQIFSEDQFLKLLWRELQRRESYYYIKLIATCVVSILILEMLVKSFTDRKLYTWCFWMVGIAASIYLIRLIPGKFGVPIIVWLACWFLSIFTLMPAEIPDNTWLVVASGVVIMVIGVVARYLDLHAEDDKCLLSLRTHDTNRPKFPMVFYLQIFLVGLSSLMVSLSTSHRTEKQELLAVHQLLNWSIAVCAMVLPLFSATGLLSRLTSIFLGFAPAFLLLSIGYEALFYCALALALMAWILFENAYVYSSKSNMFRTSTKAMEDSILRRDERFLELSDMRIALTFMVFFNIAFFGTGNFASIASFEISSVYRFITIFSPFLMAALLIFKLLIPFMLVICAFSSITKVIRVPLSGCYFLVILCSDVMTIHFFFLVRNTGSWMEIGNSISHFGIMSAQVVFVLMLFALTNVYTKDIQTRSAQHLSRKAM